MIHTFNQFDSLIQQELRLYNEKSAILYNYLTKRAEIGFTKSQFTLYRDNYFFRTYQTVICVAKVVISAAKNGDYITLASAGRNCFEETGAGVATNTHPELLLQAYNSHAKRIFNLEPISLLDSLSSVNVLPATKRFTAIQLSLYNSPSHIDVLGANYAQEEAATRMLQMFLTTFFEPYKPLYTQQEFDKITAYFICHLDGLEERHADDAKSCLFRQCKSASDRERGLKSIKKMLMAQSDMWLSLQKNLFLLETNNSPIKSIENEVSVSKFMG